MKKQELLEKLQTSVTEEEIQSLRDWKPDSGTLVISRYNRVTILEMLASPVQSGEVDDEQVGKLNVLLTNYLARYMADRPEGHKWIILASMYQALLTNRPIHPVEVTKVQIIENENGTQYLCPCREEGEDSICRFCVCRAAE